MIAQWQTRKMAELQRVGPFLTKSGRPEAILAVSKRFAEQSLDARDMTMSEARADANPRLRMSDELHAATIELLLQALRDTDMRGEHGAYWENHYIEELRICDIAGYYLNQRDSARFPFNIEAPLADRERARMALLRRWVSRGSP